VRWRELGEVENECTSYNFRLFAIFLPKIIRVGGNLTKLLQNNFAWFFETRCASATKFRFLFRVNFHIRAEI